MVSGAQEVFQPYAAVAKFLMVCYMAWLRWRIHMILNLIRNGEEMLD